MRIDSITMFKFFFSYEGTELMIPIAATDVDEAKRKLSMLFLQWSAEMTPTQQPTPSPFQPPEAPGLSEVALELRIEELMKDIATLGKQTKRTVDATVKEWTGFPFQPSNYPAIIEELERIKHGQQN